MSFFNLPKQTQVNKSVPKNAFDTYINSKQKKMFVDIIDKIKWTNKLSTETINLEGKEISEIQIFQVALRKKENIEKLLEIIDKSIPYHIIFVLTFDSQVMLSVSQKHLHPTNENNTVLDWTFKSAWFARDEMPYKLSLKENLDFVIKDFCIQLSGQEEDSGLSLNEIVAKETELEKLEKEINTLRSQIKRSKQFNRKVELNSILKEKERELARINLNN
jgi:HAMP domain-containing protein